MTQTHIPVVPFPYKIKIYKSEEHLMPWCDMLTDI